MKYAVEAGCVNIDNTSHFRMDPNVPLVVPEVNGEALKDHHGIISCPNCTTIMMCSALTRLNDEFDIEITPLDILPENFQSIEIIYQLITRLQEDN